MQAYLYVCKEREVLSSKKMFVVLSHPSDINDLTAEQLQFVPKDILLRVYGDYIDCVWNKLPEHIKADPEVQTYRRCYKHYNQPWQQTHIDGPVPPIKNCIKCLLLQRHIDNKKKVVAC